MNDVKLRTLEFEQLVRAAIEGSFLLRESGQRQCGLRLMLAVLRAMNSLTLENSPKVDDIRKAIEEGRDPLLLFDRPYLDETE